MAQQPSQYPCTTLPYTSADRNINMYYSHSHRITLYILCNFFFSYFSNLSMFSWPHRFTVFSLVLTTYSATPCRWPVRWAPLLPCPKQCVLCCTASQVRGEILECDAYLTLTDGPPTCCAASYAHPANVLFPRTLANCSPSASSITAREGTRSVVLKGISKSWGWASVICVGHLYFFYETC